MKIHNDTDETIELEPGEELEVRGKTEMKRVLASRVHHFHIDETGQIRIEKTERKK